MSNNTPKKKKRNYSIQANPYTYGAATAVGATALAAAGSAMLMSKKARKTGNNAKLNASCVQVKTTDKEVVSSPYIMYPYVIGDKNGKDLIEYRTQYMDTKMFEKYKKFIDTALNYLVT